MDIAIEAAQAKTFLHVVGDTLPISTPYYRAKIPIWHDQINLAPDAIKEWEAEWREDEAGEVVRSIGAWVVAVPKPLTKDDLVKSIPLCERKPAVKEHLDHC